MTYHILVMGDSGTGKTTYLGNFSEFIYDPKKHLSYTTLMYAQKSIHLYEYTHPFKYSMNYHNIYDHMDGVFVFFDITSTQSRRYAMKILSQLPRSLPFVLIANKCDIPHSPITCGEDFIMMSAKTQVNLHAPILSITHKLDRHKKGVFSYIRHSFRHSFRRFSIKQ